MILYMKLHKEIGKNPYGSSDFDVLGMREIKVEFGLGHNF